MATKFVLTFYGMDRYSASVQVRAHNLELKVFDKWLDAMHAVYNTFPPSDIPDEEVEACYTISSLVR